MNGRGAAIARKRPIGEWLERPERSEDDAASCRHVGPPKPVIEYFDL